MEYRMYMVCASYNTLCNYIIESSCLRFLFETYLCIYILTTKVSFFSLAERNTGLVQYASGERRSSKQERKNHSHCRTYSESLY